MNVGPDPVSSDALAQAIQLDRFAGSFREASRIVPVDDRAPGPGELRVRNTWCGVNGIFDTQIARNAVDYVSVKLPCFTGVEAMGRVEAVGAGVGHIAVGDPVVTTRFGGGYRTLNVASADQFVKVPGTAPAYLALASSGVSAWLALTKAGEAKAGECVAISAAAGGLGHLMVQMAKHLGCHVVAICGGADKAALVRRLGADRVIDRNVEDVTAVLTTEYRDRLDVAIDTVSGPIFDAFLDNLAPHGRLVVAGAAQDLEGRPEIVTAPRPVHKLYYKAASIRGFMNGLMINHWPQARAEIFPLYQQGGIDVFFDSPPFEGLMGVYDAVDRLLSGQSIGKVAVKLEK